MGYKSDTIEVIRCEKVPEKYLDCLLIKCWGGVKIHG